MYIHCPHLSNKIIVSQRVTKLSVREATCRTSGSISPLPSLSSSRKACGHRLGMCRDIVCVLRDMTYSYIHILHVEGEIYFPKHESRFQNRNDNFRNILPYRTISPCLVQLFFAQLLAELFQQSFQLLANVACFVMSFESDAPYPFSPTKNQKYLHVNVAAAVFIISIKLLSQRNPLRKKGDRKVLHSAVPKPIPHRACFKQHRLFS